MKTKIDRLYEELYKTKKHYLLTILTTKRMYLYSKMFKTLDECERDAKFRTELYKIRRGENVICEIEVCEY